MDAAHREEFLKHVRVYIRVFVALLVATVLTVAVSYVHFGRQDSHTGNIVVALVIAVAKAGLVAGFFMHLVSEKKSIYTMLGCTAAFFTGLMVLTLWAAADQPDLTTHHQIAPVEATAPSGEHSTESHVP